MADLTPEAQERARRTIAVAEVFADRAEEIAYAVGDLPDGHVLVAVVDGEHVFGGTFHVASTEVVERVPALEGEDGWAMVFVPGIDADHVRQRTSELASIAQQRIEVIDRINARRNGSDASTD
jgi:hypothetical protein